MKKLYIIPESELIDIEVAGMLCLSTGIGDDAEGPAQAPPFDEDIF